MNSHFQIIVLLVLSILIQGAAAIMAIRLIRITGRKVAWGLISIALALMAVRRIVPLVRVLHGDFSTHPPDLTNEAIGLSLSIFMAAGITLIAPLFLERIRNEQQLRETTEELDRYFTNALDLLCIADTDGCFRRLNPQWEVALGYPVAELVGRRFLDFVHPDDRETTLRAVSQLASQKEIQGFVNRYRRKDGSYCWIEWRSFPSGSRVYAVARDITERKQAEAALQQLNQELDRRVKERTAELEAKNKELEQMLKAFVGRELRMTELKQRIADLEKMPPEIKPRTDA